MSNYGLACMILDRVIEGFFYESDTTISDYDNSYSDDRTRTGTDDRTVSDDRTATGYESRTGTGTGTDDRTSTDDGIGVLPVKDDKGKLISCDTRGKEGLEDLSQIKIVKQVGGSDISFKYGDQVFDWNSHAKNLGSGSYGEVKSFTLSDGKNVAIKKYPTWKFKKDKERNIIEDIEKLDNDYNEGIILKTIDKKCNASNDCIRFCDIIPAHYIQEEGQDDQAKFFMNTGLPDGQYSDNFKQKYPKWPKSMEYSFIAMEAMTGSLKKYSGERKKELLKAKDTKEKRKLLDEIFVNVTKIILKVAKILKCLSDKGYYYPDLKSDNVLYKCDGENIIIKLGDIGSLTTEKNLERGHYIRTWFDSQGNSQKSKNHAKWKSNLKYYHVHLLGYLYIEILAEIFGINFGVDSNLRLKDYTKIKYNEPNDEQIREDIRNFIYKISTSSKIPPGYNFTTGYYDAVSCQRSEENSCIGEHLSELINEVLHKTIVSQLELSEEGQQDIQDAKQNVRNLTDQGRPENEVIEANRERIRREHTHSFRYANESELIRVLERKIDKINSDEEGQEY